jgi:site-specific DNA-cytosine methylase
VRVNVLNALATSPQHRERLFLVAFRHDLAHAANSFTWPTFPAPEQHGQHGGARTLRDVLEHDLDADALHATRLTPAQWALVRSSHDFRKCAGWRLAQLDGAARTLRGSYRKSFSRLSEVRYIGVCSNSGDPARCLVVELGTLPFCAQRPAVDPWSSSLCRSMRTALCR